MATHTLAILVEAIGAAKASKDLKGVERTVSNIGAHAGRGLRTAASNLVGIGAIAGAGIAVAVKTGLDDLATLESAVTSVDGAIKQMGLTGQVTGQQVAGWANDIEASVQAAFDDKDITKATATLVRFGHLAPKNIKPAMVVMTDLAVKTGSVDSAATLLSKALADPTKASGKLARAGVILTKQQQKQIDTLVKAGKVSEAQALIIESVGRVTKDAAKNSVGPYGDAINELSDASEDARKALAIGFLPVIEKVANLLSTELAKPEVLKGLQDFGTTLAGGLDSAIDIARNLPWGAIGDAFKVAGQGAKTVLGMFTSLPPWIQTAVLTGWGLNKLTGGALGDIVGDIGKGLIKGVLGMTAGVVNIKAGVVNGVPGGSGGGPGGGGGAAGEGGARGGTGGAAIFIPDMHQFNQDMADQLSRSGTPFGQAAGKAFQKQADQITPWDQILHALGLKDLPSNVGPASSQAPVGEHAKIATPIVAAEDRIHAAVQAGFASMAHAVSSQHPVGEHAANWDALLTSFVPTVKLLAGQVRATQTPFGEKGHLSGIIDRRTKADTLVSDKVDKLRPPLTSIKTAQDQAQQAFRDGERTTETGLSRVDSTTRSGTMGTTAAVNTGSSRIVSAITGFRIPAPIVTVTVGPGSVTKSVTTQNRAGPANGSAGGGSHGGGGNLPT